jgi:iron(III) transport system substrate-binding protein
MSMKRRTFLASGAAMTAVAVHQAWNPAQSFAQSGKVVNLYSARHYDADNQIYEGFFRKTGIKVNLVEASADKLIERVKSEGSNSPADVIITVDAGNLWRTQQEDLFQKVPASSLLYQKVAANLRDPGGYWFGFTKRARVIMYNKSRVKPAEIARYEDLADPKWRSKVLVRSSGNVYNQSLVGSIITTVGEPQTESWLKGIVANFARKPEGNDTSQIKAVAAGVGDLTLANTYYLVRLSKSSKPDDRDVASKVGVIFPNQRDRGTHVNISGGGIAKYAPHREAALQYLEYLASSEAQQIFAGNNYEYPVVQGVSKDSVLTSFGNFKEDQLNAKIFGEKNAAALQMMDRAGWA